MGWGHAIGFESLEERLRQIQKYSSVVLLDRWNLTINNMNKKTADKMMQFQNYFSVGVDAEIVLRFHQMREESPKKFFSQTINKLFYGLMGFRQIVQPTCENMKQDLKLFVDDNEISIPDGTEGLVVINISSYGGRKIFINLIE